MAPALGRVSAALLAVVLVLGHTGVCAAAGWLSRPGAERPAPTCPFHQSASAPTAVAGGAVPLSMSCCTPADRQEATAAAIAPSPVASGEPVIDVGPAVPPAPARPALARRARDEGPPSSLRTHLLFSVFLV